MDFFIVFCYIFFLYGIASLMVYFNGPWDIVEKFRRFAHWVHPKFGELFTCIFCISTWIGGFVSAFNYFFIPIKFTPFNIIFDGTHYWWLIIIMDAMFGCGTNWILHELEEMMERIGINNNEE